MQPDINPELIKSPWVAGAMGAIVALRGVPGLSWPSACSTCSRAS